MDGDTDGDGPKMKGVVVVDEVWEKQWEKGWTSLSLSLTNQAKPISWVNVWGW